MKIIYISSACNPKEVQKINKTAIKKLEISGVKFHNLLIKGFSENNVEVISIIGLPISKATNKKIFWKRNIDEYDNVKYHRVGFINLPGLKQFSNIITMMITYTKYARKSLNTYVIIDATYISIIPFIMFLNKIFKLPIIGIVADIYNYMCDVDNDNKKIKMFSKFIRNIVKKSYLKLNGFILLTEQMNEVINLKNKPYTVIEGCADSKMNYIKKKESDKNIEKKILYTGKLSTKFGIKTLVEAFKKLKDKNIKLIIYGDGEEREYLLNQTQSNIIYKGMVPNEEVINAQIEADLLINPRPTSEEYTKYSFPSKIIEYMSTGTPLLTTELAGIPKEYYKYIYTIEDEEIEGIKEAIEKVFQIKEEERLRKAIEAKEFVMNYKNEQIQAKKIIDFIRGELKENV